ncbi:MAG: diadenylate cyclase [Opitutaceae bacterium]|jgi:DNA integrity scanning protein DisA with diadenylate cyclase activity/mannitol/fructose-specific phosphotransferase system IIA component (Ntr-type)|nr:diadenylate cyclase [Opitutaceae bacterium]
MSRRLEKIITRKRIIELASEDMRGALAELIGAAAGALPDLKKDALLAVLLQRESTMSSHLGGGVALPHARVPMRRRYLLVIGRSVRGIPQGAGARSERTHLIFLLLASENAHNYLNMLASLARLLRDGDLVRQLAAAPGPAAIFAKLRTSLDGLLERTAQARQNRTNMLMIREAERVARGAACSAILVFGDTFVGGIEPGAWFPKSKTILVTRNHFEFGDGGAQGAATSVLQVRAFSGQRMAQLRSALLLAVTRGLISIDDRLCCLGGLAGDNQFDTIVVVDTAREFQGMATTRSDLLPEGLNPEVLERVIAIALELGIEGREGKPVGCLFVVGDAASVEKHIKPLVLNPFFGYKEEDRNILSPFMDETVKEFSSIDGAFVIRGDGVLLSAGSLIQADERGFNLPSGLGSRHAAAAAISAATNCIAVVVSSSSGQVTLFRRGVMLPLSEKPIGSGT